VLCLDEFGPLEIRPQPGENWVIKPDLIPATYTRNLGVRHLIAFLDLSSNKIYGHIKRRKRWRELLQILKYVRSLYKGKLYIILDNFSPHRKDDITSWCKKNDVELVFLPTNASWLNRIECHFTALRKFAIRNSNYQNHKELGSAIRRYIIWRNKNHEDKRIKLIENRVNFL
jgi:transposase